MKYFVIVDILINLMGKVNVNLSPLLARYVDQIKQAELPPINFMEVTSPIDDGGALLKQDYTTQKEKEGEELAKKAQSSTTVPQNRNLQAEHDLDEHPGQFTNPEDETILES